MGRFLKGILGGFSGKVGNVVGACIRGVDYMRSLPRKSTKPPTEAQLKQRTTFGLVVTFLRPITALINVGYQSYKGKETPMNAATSYHLEKAVMGVYPNLSINYPKVLISKGTLLRVANAEVVTAAGTSEIEFNWTNNAAVGSTNGTDKATFMVYSDQMDEYVVLSSAVPRSAETFALVVPLDFIGQEVHCWMSFVRADGKQVSDSKYVAKIRVL
nr:DUF6266 family protein [Pedobacter panaciterrae]